MRRARVALIAATAAGTIAVAGLVGAGAGRAAPMSPTVGECYALSDAQEAGEYWTVAAAVPCTQPHTFEVTETGPVPMDVDAIDFARDRCGPLDVWTALGVNASIAGIIADPIRVEARSYYARPDQYVCGAVVVEHRGRDPKALVSLEAPFERMRAGELSRLRHCSSADDGRSALAPEVTVPCRTRPSWRTTAWILWAALYDEYPGRSALRESAAELCGRGTTWSLPAPAEWSEGMPRTWCYQLRT